MTHYVLHSFTGADVNRCIDELGRLALARYDNPFEQKYFLEHKTDMLDCPALQLAMNELREGGMVRTVQRLLNVPVDYADWHHYGGLFVYKPGDYLAPHVDAGLHPETGERKAATAILYLTDATLSFWSGDLCTSPDPEVWLEKQIPIRAGECVVFSNTDDAWHSVPTVPHDTPQPGRVCLTVSYMAPVTFKHSRYTNKRTRAYFARRHGTSDTPELAALREQRASEEAHRVYRLGKDVLG